MSTRPAKPTSNKKKAPAEAGACGNREVLRELAYLDHPESQSNKKIRAQETIMSRISNLSLYVLADT
jgi:hypothetical protein